MTSRKYIPPADADDAARPVASSPVEDTSSRGGEPAKRPAGKGRPTRSRAEALAARRKPLVPADRKAARAADRQHRAEERQRTQQALVTGDETNMPPAHRGPERRFVRDLVDARWNVGELFFPVALVILMVTLILPLLRPDLYGLANILMLIVLWGGIALTAIDAVVLRRRLRAALTERFGSVGQGLVSYGILRSIQMRMLRLPKPQVGRGQAPR
ncbi:DUF3043 domain-containing protein [Brachybacterium sp. EF45031]|uniref:DUF3043 domain-containing protein n=1 Tax=Brachybacterium sillae TaxID=2810536 RepID=UPI00217D8CA9|nr:DUF3043 domain-containing protein [Brachybacterium sillae]MCS6712734.1 DUF3043 domain-containing protein [Brachybacterium sillae]